MQFVLFVWRWILSLPLPLSLYTPTQSLLVIYGVLTTTTTSFLSDNLTRMNHQDATAQDAQDEKKRNNFNFSFHFIPLAGLL